MSKGLIRALVLAALAFLAMLESHAATQEPETSAAAPLSTQIYQQRLEQVQLELRSCTQTLATCQQPRTATEDAYAARYYVQQVEIRDVEISIYRWQILAANVVLTLVSLLTVAAVSFCGFQLWRSQRLSKLPPNLIEIELSLSKLKLQTSLIGVAVLVASYGFLLVFTREIYQLRAVDRVTPASAAGISAPNSATSPTLR